MNDLYIYSVDESDILLSVNEVPSGDAALSSEGISSSEEIEQILPEELVVDETETTAEIVYQSVYSPDDLKFIHDDLNSIYTALQIIACLLVVLVLFKVLALGRTLIDAIF